MNQGKEPFSTFLDIKNWFRETELTNIFIHMLIITYDYRIWENVFVQISHLHCINIHDSCDPGDAKFSNLLELQQGCANTGFQMASHGHLSLEDFRLSTLEFYGSGVPLLSSSLDFKS